VRKMRKRLTLSRETLVKLDHSELQPVAGATTQFSTCYGCASYTCRPPCEYTGHNTCTSCQLTCTTNFC
jgi:hypothetical protein